MDPFSKSDGSIEQVGGPILLVDDDIFGPLTSTVGELEGKWHDTKCGESISSPNTTWRKWENQAVTREPLFQMVG